MFINFYNDTLCKITYSPLSQLDFSRIDKKLEVGKDYVVKLLPDNPVIVTDCYDAKQMMFEIRNVKEAELFDNSYSCSVRCIEYEEGNEYPNTENVVVVGYFYNAYPEAIYNSIGYWDTGKDGREIFFITEREQLINSSENSIQKYLISLFKGKKIGKLLISKIINEFGCDTLEKLRDDSPELKALVKSDAKRELIIELVEKSVDSEKTLNFLVQNNIDAEIAIDIINKLGSTSYSQIIEDPYVLLKFNSLTIEQVNEIAMKLQAPYDAEKNIDGLIMRYLYYRTQNFGDIYVNQNDFTEKHNGFTNFELFYDKYNRNQKFKTVSILDALKRLAAHKRIVVQPSVQDPSTQCIYEYGYYVMESYIVNKLKYFNTTLPVASLSEKDTLEAIKEVNVNNIKLDKQQEAAVVSVFKSKLSIISGGPGTGKTFVTKMIVDVFKKRFPSLSIQLCAPTGKASRRMSEVIGLPACTIHKKLGYGTGETLDIDENLLIIDECSMMDIDLFYKTLSAVSDDTTIVLVGDYNQLPSVGPGLILRDLVDSEKIPATMLKSVFRQSNGSEIITAANAVLNKQSSKINREYGKDFVFVEQTSKQEIYENISGSIKYLINHGVSADRIQILTPQNEGLIGTTGLNNLMRDICNPPKTRGSGVLVRNTMFYPGDRIIETENNSELRIFNGSIGTILRVSSDEVVADFDGMTVVLSMNDMKTIKLGYAITVHKSQGSEFDYVFMPLINEHEFTLNKNLLYTGITRAKKMFVLLGQTEVLTNTIQKEIIWDRKSQIKPKLINS